MIHRTICCVCGDGSDISQSLLVRTASNIFGPRLKSVAPLSRHPRSQIVEIVRCMRQLGYLPTRESCPLLLELRLIFSAQVLSQ